MAERKMHLTSRLICECLRDHPKSTAVEVAREMGVNAERIKKMLLALIEQGYVRRLKKLHRGYPMVLTGKPFPPSSEWELSPEHLRRLNARNVASASLILGAAVRNMVLVGRAAA
ncbi:MAG: hypothetical protein V4801_10385 [Burkholderia gladioli]